MNQNIFRNLVVVILLCMLAITTLVINPSNTSKVEDNKKDKETSNITTIDETIVVFLENDIEIEKIENIKKEIMNIISKDDEVLFKSKEQIKQEMMKENETFYEVLNGLEENPLNDVFYVKIKEGSNVYEIIDLIKEIDGVYQVEYSSVLDKQKKN